MPESEKPQSSLPPDIERPTSLSKEVLREKFRPNLTITFMRHGQPQYTEKEKETADWEGTLTEEGKEQVRQSALRLATEVKKNNEAVIIWASTRTRADETAEILTNVLESEGVEVWDRNKIDEYTKHRPTPSLRAPKMTKEFWDLKPKDEFFVRIWQELDEEGKLPEGVETLAEAEKKFKRLLEYNRRVATLIKKGQEENPQLPSVRIINIGHFETPKPLLQEAYGGNIGIDKETGLGNAEFLNIDMQLTDDENIKNILRVDYEKGIAQDEEGSKEVFLAFDSDRNFHKID